MSQEKKWYKHKVEASVGEIIYEVTTADDGLGFSYAIADIQQSERHLHAKGIEIYTVINGEVELTINGQKKVLGSGDSFKLLPKADHSAKSLTNERARVAVHSNPPWTPEDHILVDIDV